MRYLHFLMKTQRLMARLGWTQLYETSHSAGKYYVNSKWERYAVQEGTQRYQTISTHSIPRLEWTKELIKLNDIALC